MISPALACAGMLSATVTVELARLSADRLP